MLEGAFKVIYSDQQLAALEVLGGLFERPYRVLHLAGHGQFESPRTAGGKARSGMVLDNGVFLTAVEIGQMQQVPELVFLNCCHIGKTGPEASVQTGVEFNRLAASVARELIEMGVRAVVAAGWAVRDDAALYFARAFYEEMLNNETFGRALQNARRKTFTNPEFRDCNTWGAYQAYGDPDFQFDPGASRARQSSSVKDLVAPAELVEELRGILRSSQDAQTQKDPEQSRKANLDRLGKLIEDCPRDWLAQSEVLMALGVTYGELAQFESAIGYLRRALDTGELDNVTTLKAVEQLANFEARHGAKEGSVEQLYEAIYLLQGLNEFSETAERLSLIGGAYKRITQLVTEPAEVLGALEQSAGYYRLAHERNVARGFFDPYPALNWLTGSALLGQPVPQVDALLSRCDAEAIERYARTHDPFDAVASVDVEIVRALFSGSLAVEAGSLAERYQETFARTVASAREIDSVLSQLNWMDHMLAKLEQAKSGERRSGVRAALAVIRTQLSGGDRVTDGRLDGNSGAGASQSPNTRRDGKRATGGKGKAGSRRARRKGTLRKGSKPSPDKAG
jgi:tetratricopeptide (TPR) repeat protein